MSTTKATQRRRPTGGKSSSGDNAATTVPSTTTATTTSTAVVAVMPPPPSSSNIPIATVKRRKCGTGAFDEHWLNLDCCGLFCAFLTYALHCYACYAICYILLPPWMSYYSNSTNTLVADDNSNSNNTADQENINNEFMNHMQNQQQQNQQRHLSFWGYFHCIGFSFVAIMACISHFKAMTTDPGAVPPDAKPLPDPEPAVEVKDEHGNVIKKRERGRRLCRRCNSFKPARAHHCSVCKRCIIKMDHHCPWVNNCVGIGNHKYFLLFIYYTALSCLYTMSLLIARFFVCMNSTDSHHEHGHLRASGARHHARGFSQASHHRSRRHHHHINNHCLDEPMHLLNIIGLMVEAMLFGLFTSCMMVDQWDVVLSNVTHIDRLKGETSNTMSTVSGLTEVFGFERKRTSSEDSNSNSKELSTTSSSNNSSSSSRSFRFDWFLPFGNLCFPQSIRDDIFGYCRPCGMMSATTKGETIITPTKKGGVVGRKNSNEITNPSVGSSTEMQPLVSSSNIGGTSSSNTTTSSVEQRSKMIKSVEEII